MSGCFTVWFYLHNILEKDLALIPMRIPSDGKVHKNFQHIRKQYVRLIKDDMPAMLKKIKLHQIKSYLKKYHKEIPLDVKCKKPSLISLIEDSCGITRCDLLVDLAEHFKAAESLKKFKLYDASRVYYLVIKKLKISQKLLEWINYLKIKVH